MVDVNRILEQGEPLSQFSVDVKDQEELKIKAGVYRLGDRDYVVDRVQEEIIDSYIWNPDQRQE